MKPFYVKQERPYTFCTNTNTNNPRMSNRETCVYRFKKTEFKVFKYCPMCGVEIDWENVEENIW